MHYFLKIRKSLLRPSDDVPRVISYSPIYQSMVQGQAMVEAWLRKRTAGLAGGSKGL
jgi:hypothetical protein